MRIYENSCTRKVCVRTKWMDPQLKLLEYCNYPNFAGIEIMRSIVYIEHSTHFCRTRKRKHGNIS